MKKFSKDHVWIEADGNIGTIGISDYAQNQLGDIVYVNFSKKINDIVSYGDEIAEIESLKSIGQIYAPLNGKIIEFNIIFEDQSKVSIINEAPYSKGWLIKLEISNSGQLESLMDEKQYKDFIINS